MPLNPSLPYNLIATTPSIAAGGASTQVLTLDQDAVFRLISLACRTSLDLVGDAEPNNCTIQITDQGSGRQWSNAPMPQNLFAPRQFNKPVPPIQLQPGSIIRIDIVNTGAAANVITVCLGGQKLYPEV